MDVVRSQQDVHVINALIRIRASVPHLPKKDRFGDYVQCTGFHKHFLRNITWLKCNKSCAYTLQHHRNERRNLGTDGRASLLVPLATQQHSVLLGCKLQWVCIACSWSCVQFVYNRAFPALSLHKAAACSQTQRTLFPVNPASEKGVADQ